jgi:hypothetical protein
MREWRLKFKGSAGTIHARGAEIAEEEESGTMRATYCLPVCGGSSRRPTLRTMDQVDNFHRFQVFKHPVYDDEGQRWQRHFACTLNAPEPAGVGEGP